MKRVGLMVGYRGKDSVSGKKRGRKSFKDKMLAEVVPDEILTIEKLRTMPGNELLNIDRKKLREKLREISLDEIDMLEKEFEGKEKKGEELITQVAGKIESFEPIRTVFCECGTEMIFDWTKKATEAGWSCPKCFKISNEYPPYQKKILEYIHQGKKVVLLVGGSGVGKTVLDVVVVGSACLGIQPWDLKTLPPPLDKPPVKARILCSDWEKHAATVIVPKLKEWLPQGEYETHKNNLGIESVFNFRNKSSIELITNKQATQDHAGWEGQIVIGDEPFDRDKFIENLRGLRNPPERGGMGIFLITMTAVNVAWVLDDIVRNTDPGYASITDIPQDANPFLTEEYKRIYRASMKENERIARIYGGFVNLVGLIWPTFRPEIHLIDDFKVPTDWPVVPMIDWHINKPIAVSCYASDQRDMHYLIDEFWQQGSAEEIGDEIIRRKRLNPWKIEEAFIDPLSKGDTAYVKNMGIEIKDTFTRMKEKLWKEGIDLKVATKDKDSGIKNVEDMLKGLNGIPSLFFFRSLTNKIKDEGTVWEIQRWVYDENGKPKDENDHFMENLYRMTLVDMKYYPENEKRQTVADSEYDIFNPAVAETENRIEAWR